MTLSSIQITIQIMASHRLNFRMTFDFNKTPTQQKYPERYSKIYFFSTPKLEKGVIESILRLFNLIEHNTCTVEIMRLM